MSMRELEAIMEDGLKMLEIGQRMVDFAKTQIDEEVEDIHDEERPKRSVDINEDLTSEMGKLSKKESIITAIRKGTRK